MEKNEADYKLKCPYCGNNPVPHFVNWYFESVNILLTPIRQWFLGLFSFISFPGFALALARAGIFLGIINFQDDIKKCKVERAKVLWEEAEKRGIKMRELLLFGKPFDVYEAIANREKRIEKRKGSAKEVLSDTKLVFSGLPRPKNINRAALDAMDDKAILKKKFMAAGLPVPRGGSVWNFSQAKKIFNNIQSTSRLNPIPYTLNPISVIVKPRSGSRGRHSTTFVSSPDELKRAYKIAKQLCFWVVVEEMLHGPVYRATLINYELCGALRGDAPQVTGDGVHTISELIEIKNNQPHSGVKSIIVDSGMRVFLARQNLDISSILKKDQVVTLSEKIGVNYGGSSSEDFEICHPDNKELFVKAAKVVNDPIIGFDFVIPDITKPWHQQKCGFLEANSLPFINLHHHPLLGTPRNVAAKVWDMVGESF